MGTEIAPQNNPSLIALQNKFPRPNPDDFKPSSVDELLNGTLGVLFDVAGKLRDELIAETKTFLELYAKKQWLFMQGMADGTYDEFDHKYFTEAQADLIQSFLLYKRVIVAASIVEFVNGFKELLVAALRNVFQVSFD